MKKMLLSFSFSYALAVSSINVLLEHPSLPTADKGSLMRGGEIFKSRCLSCHALMYAEYDPLVQELGISKEIMPKHSLAAWQGHPPPDLSLVARTRGTDWVYTYLHSFYKDPQNPKGYNNLLMPNANMPAVLSDLQGIYVLIGKREDVSGIPHSAQWFAYLKQEKSGVMDAGSYSEYVLDLVNFLDHVSEPYRQERKSLGWKVLIFLFAFALVSRLLYNSYWYRIKEN